MREKVPEQRWLPLEPRPTRKELQQEQKDRSKRCLKLAESILESEPFTGLDFAERRLRIGKNLIRVELSETYAVSENRSRSFDILTFCLAQDKNFPNRFKIRKVKGSDELLEKFQNSLARKFNGKGMILVPVLTERTENIKRNLIRITQAKGPEAKARIYLEIVQEAADRIFRDDQGRRKIIWNLVIEQDQKDIRCFYIKNSVSSDRVKFKGQLSTVDRFYIRYESLVHELEPYGIEVIAPI